MIVKTAAIRYTPDDLLAMPDGAAYELVNGQLMERNVGALSSLVEAFVCERLLVYVRACDAGLVWPSSMGYQIFPSSPEKVRKPDVSFIGKDKLSNDVMESGFIKVAPDLAVEVLSPNDLAYEVDRKVAEYFSAGVRLIWIVNPETRTVTIYRPDGTGSKLNEKDTLEGEVVLPGFHCQVRDFFPDEAKMKALGLT